LQVGTLVQEKSLDYSTSSSKKSFETLLPAVAKTQNLLPNIRRSLFWRDDSNL